MSTYILLPLHFLAPVHFGDASGGGGLDAVQPIGRADTFYSALCCEAIRQGESALERLVRKTEIGDITFSDLLPWYQRDGKYEWYVPKPVLSMPVQPEKDESLQEAKTNSSTRKQEKKRAFIRASELSVFVNNLSHGGSSSFLKPTEEPVFGTVVSQVHFNSRTTKPDRPGTPYSVGSYFFNKGAGLYSLLCLEKAEDIKWLLTLVRLTGLSGIGGRKSSGMGRYDVQEVVPLSPEDQNKDTAALYGLLEDKTAEEQMSLSSVLPQEEEISLAARARGLWIRRSGLSWSQGMDVPVKMHPLYMLASGSCFDSRLTGRIADVSTPAVGHPVYRYGKGLYVGVPK